jgi:hypothetical protein
MSQIWSQAHNIIISTSLITRETACHDKARRNSNTYGNPKAKRTEFIVQLTAGGHYFQARLDCALGVVLMGAGIAEERHCAIAGISIYISFVSLDGFGTHVVK